MLILDTALVRTYPLPDSFQESLATNLMSIGTFACQQSFNNGLRPEQDLPSFLRFAGQPTSQRFRAVRQWMNDLANLAQEWLKESGGTQTTQTTQPTQTTQTTEPTQTTQTTQPTQTSPATQTTQTTSPTTTAGATTPATTSAAPTPPQPTTATVDPGRTGVVIVAAPNPVDTPHASRHAFSSGISSGIFTACAAWTIVRSVNVPVRSVGASVAPSDARCARHPARRCAEQRRGSPRRQASHFPQGARPDLC